MQINFKQIFKSYDDTVVTINGLPEGEPLTLGKLAIGALAGPQPIDQMGRPVEPLTPEEQLRRYQIGFKIMESTGATEISVEDIALIKKAIASRNSWPLVVGQAMLMLEGKDNEP